MTRDDDQYKASDSPLQTNTRDDTNPVGGQEPTDPDPHPDTARTVARGAFVSSVALAILHLLLFLFVDCLRWLNLILALYHAGFAVFAVRSLQAPTGPDEEPTDPDRHIDT